MNQMMSLLLPFIIICYVIVSVTAQGPLTDYCFITCKHTHFDVHVVCKRSHRCPNDTDCPEYQANKAWRQKLLDLVNEDRNNIASGKNKLGIDNPGSKKMYALSYDMELEFIITCHLNQCGEVVYEGCVDSVRFPALMRGCLTKVSGFPEALWACVTKSHKFDFKVNLEKDEGFVFQSDHYSWAASIYSEARYMGCSARMFKIDDFSGSQIICIFGPVILREGDFIFRYAKSPNDIASECEGGKNEKYTSLCGEIEAVPSEEMWSHLELRGTGSKIMFTLYILYVPIMISYFICNTV